MSGKSLLNTFQFIFVVVKSVLSPVSDHSRLDHVQFFHQLASIVDLFAFVCKLLARINHVLELTLVNSLPTFLCEDHIWAMFSDPLDLIIHLL